MRLYRASYGGWRASGCTCMICRRSTRGVVNGARHRSTAPPGNPCGGRIGSPSTASRNGCRSHRRATRLRRYRLRPQSSVSVTECRLYVEILFESEDSELTAIARLLIASKRQTAVERSSIEVSAPCANAVGDSASAVEVPGLHEPCQAEQRVIGDFD